MLKQLYYWYSYRRVAPLMAQAVYEPLSLEEEDVKRKIFARYPELASEFEELRVVMASIQLSEEPWEGDLLPAIKAQLKDEPIRQRMSKFSVLAATAGVLVLIAGLYSIFMLSEGPVSVRQDTAPLASESPLALMERIACEKVSSGDTRAAAEMLEQAILAHPEDPHRAAALLTLADIEYTYNQRYEHAFEIFKTLEREHNDVFRRYGQHDKRARLLVAAFSDNFEPLRELENASRTGDPIRAYENIIAQYPDKIWSDEAMRLLCRIVADRVLKDRPADVVQVLRYVRDACTHPVAQERLDLEIGNYFCDSLDDADKARHYYLQAAESRNAFLAVKAREALARLE